MKHKTGNQYNLYGEVFLLGWFRLEGIEYIALFSLTDGNRYSDPIIVKDSLKITDKEFESACGSNKDYQFTEENPIIKTTLP